MSRCLQLFAAALLCTVLAPLPASAQGGGIRAGVSGEPDQFFFGAHLDLGPIADRLTFRPNAEVGLGNDLTTVAMNFEFAYWFQRRPRAWKVYAGGGPALILFRPTNRGTDANPGFNVLVGIEHVRGFFTELKLGLLDSPQVKFVFGYTFR